MHKNSKSVNEKVKDQKQRPSLKGKVSETINSRSKISSKGKNLHAIPATKKISMIKEGFSKNDLNKIKEACDFDYDTLSNILSVSRAKLINKKGNEKFDQNTSERIMHLRDVIDYGQEVFEDKNAFNEWLRKNSMALGGKTP